MNIEILSDLWLDLEVLFVGVFLGFLLRRLGHHFIATHVYWMVMGGAIFFFPIMLDNVFHGTLGTTRTLGIFGLWCIFSLGMALGTKIRNGMA